MEKIIKTIEELDILVAGNIIHATEKDWLAKGLDNGYEAHVKIEPEEDGKFPFTMTLTRKGEILKKGKDVKHEAKIFGLDGKRITSRNQRRKKEREKK